MIKIKKLTQIKKLIQFILVFMTGMLFGNLIWHFRLKEPILFRELLLALQSDGTPFLDWFVLGSFVLILMWAIYFIGFVFIKRGKKRTSGTCS